MRLFAAAEALCCLAGSNLRTAGASGVGFSAGVDLCCYGPELASLNPVYS